MENVFTEGDSPIKRLEDAVDSSLCLAGDRGATNVDAKVFANYTEQQQTCVQNPPKKTPLWWKSFVVGLLTLYPTLRSGGQHDGDESYRMFGCDTDSSRENSSQPVNVATK